MAMKHQELLKYMDEIERYLRRQGLPVSDHTGRLNGPHILVTEEDRNTPWPVCVHFEGDVTPEHPLIQETVSSLRRVAQVSEVQLSYFDTPIVTVARID